MYISKLYQLCENFELSVADKKRLEEELRELLQSAKTLAGNVHTSRQQRWVNQAYQAGIEYREEYNVLRKAGEIDIRYAPLKYMTLYHYSDETDMYFNHYDSRYFFTLGFENEPKPRLVTGYRFGKFRKLSYNYRDNLPEQGVSVFYVDGEPIDYTVLSTSTLWWSDDVYTVTGWLMDGVFGSDGEPMILPCWEDD